MAGRAETKSPDVSPDALPSSFVTRVGANYLIHLALHSDVENI